MYFCVSIRMPGKCKRQDVSIALHTPLGVSPVGQMILRPIAELQSPGGREEDDPQGRRRTHPEDRCQKGEGDEVQAEGGEEGEGPEEEDDEEEEEEEGPVASANI